MDYSLTELQLDIMRVLWEHNESTVVEIHDRLREQRSIAQSTVATLLSRLEKKGLVDHRTEGRQYVYRALVSEQKVRRSMVAEFSELAERLFKGDLAALVSSLLTAREIESDDLARVKAMIEAKERELKESDG